MKMLRRFALAIAIAIAEMAVPPPSSADEPTVGQIELHAIGDDPRIGFITKFFYRHFPSVANWSFASQRRSQENWTAIVRHDAFVGDVDLGGPGSPELVVVIDNPNWCYEIGCLGVIFRKAGSGYEFICQAPLPGEDQPKATISGSIDSGYRRILTPTHVIEWNARQEFDTGSLCAVENNE
jgi:hypothetical protein